MVIQASHSAVSASLQSLILSSPSNLQNSWNYSSLVGRERSGVIEFSLKKKCSEHFSWVSSLLLPSCTLSSPSLLDFSPFNSSSPFSLFPSIYRNFPKSKKSKTERRRCRDFFFLNWASQTLHSGVQIPLWDYSFFSSGPIEPRSHETRNYFHGVYITRF